MRALRKHLPLALSLAFHALVGAGLFFAWEKTQLPEKPEAILVDLTSLDETLSSSATEAPSPTRPSLGSRNAGASRPTNDISGLGLSSLRPAGPSPLENPLRPGEHKGEDDAFSPYAASEGAFQAKDIASFGAYNWLHHKIQLSLGYPGAFIRNGIEGRAQARFRLSAAGTLLPESIHVKADSPYLRVYVHRLLEHTFRGLEVPPHMRKWRDDLEVLAFVQFSLVESKVALSLDIPTPIVGNRLFFARKSAEGKNAVDKLRWKVGPVQGLLPVPVVGVDMLWFAEQAKEAGRQRHPVDELAPWREDPLFHQGG